MGQNKIQIADFSASGTTNSTTFLRGDNTWASLLKYLTSTTVGEMSGTTSVTNIVEVSQVDFDLGTPLSGTTYLITS